MVQATTVVSNELEGDGNIWLMTLSGCKEAIHVSIPI